MDPLPNYSLSLYPSDLTSDYSFSSLVPTSTNVQATQPAQSDLSTFLSTIGSLAQPIAQVVTAANAPKAAAPTTSTEGIKTPTPTLTTGLIPATGGIPTSYLFLGAAALVGVFVLMKVMK